MKREVIVLRYGHRPYRDQRVTTHCCLVARAFGAKKIIVHGTRDKTLEKSVSELTKKWGGSFELEFTDSWQKTLKKLKEKKFKAVHLTMYGKPITKKIKEIQGEKKLVVIIGSQKVEIGVYKESDYNIAIGKQPHSEIAALAIFLDRLFQGAELEKKFANAKIVLTKKDEKG